MKNTRLRHNPAIEPSPDPRAPLPAWLPRPVKRDSGRADISRTPAHVRVIGGEVDDDVRALIRRKLGMKLGKFATSIERVSFRVADANGPRGGADQVCSVKVVLSGLPSVMIERQHGALHTAIDAALSATEQAVRRTVRRRRMKPLRRGTQAGSSTP
jgi:ribosome-associated translation inhibitor RaiA